MSAEEHIDEPIGEDSNTESDVEMIEDEEIRLEDMTLEQLSIWCLGFVNIGLQTSVIKDS